MLLENSLNFSDETGPAGVKLQHLFNVSVHVYGH